MKWLRALLLTTGLMAVAGTAFAFVPQTITVDGVNDFNPANLLQDDRGDTEIKDWCTDDAANDSTLDIGRVFITNDANYLYIGWDYFEDCFSSPTVQLGLAFDVKNTPAGGVDDPFTRKIGWTGLTNKPDAYIYIEENGFNYEIFYKWNGTAWIDSTTLINPAGAGSNALNATNTSRFVELRIPLTALRVVAGNVINLETWVTQNGATKGPLDALCSDAIQMSRPSGTTFDTAAVVQMTCMLPYTIQNAVDNTAPTVVQANAVNFTLNPNKTFVPATTKIDVLFDEPVDLTTSEVEANYVFTGPVSRTIISALRDGANTSLVHLVLNSAISANAAFNNITVTGVKDGSIAGNTIVANGTTNVGSFFIQNLNFENNVKLRLCKGEFAANDSFYVEGSISPLTFSVGDNARMLDANLDSIYTATVPFGLVKSRITGKAEADLEYKFSHTPGVDQYEAGSNRTYHMSSDSGATRTLSGTWSNDQVADFTTKPIDVIFKVNAASPYVVGATKVWLVGSSLPLTFNLPGVVMADNGVFPDQTSGDKIYTARVRFPRCTPKNIGWKVAYDSAGVDTVYECLGQDNRGVFLNDAVFDTVGGAGGPITLPARGVNRCQISDKAVAVTFRVQMGSVTPLPSASDTVAVMGSHSPRVTSAAHAFPMNADRPVKAASRLLNNGTPPDASAGDGVFTRTLVFPDSTGLSVNFKYWLNTFTNNGFECEGFGDRFFSLNDVANSVAVPMVRNVDLFNNCQDLVDVPWVPNPADAISSFGVLRQSYPNPASARMSIRFDLKRSGHVTLYVFDVTGRRVSTLVDRALESGPHEVAWNGRDLSSGKRLPSGVYVYELAMGGERLTRRMIVTQ